MLQQTPAVLGEHHRVEAALHQVHVQKPAKQQAVLQFLAEGPLAAHRVEGDEQRAFSSRSGGTDARPTS